MKQLNLVHLRDILARAVLLDCGCVHHKQVSYHA